jgi:hypothetical protein
MSPQEQCLSAIALSSQREFELTDETNESCHVVPEADSTNEANNPSAEQVGTEGCTSGATKKDTPQVSNGRSLPCLVNGRKQKLPLVVGRRYVLPNWDNSIYLLLVFSGCAEGVYTFANGGGKGEYSFEAKDLQRLEAYTDWYSNFGPGLEPDAQHSVAPVAQESDDISKQVGEFSQRDTKSRPAAAEGNDVAGSESLATPSDAFTAVGMGNERGSTNEIGLTNWHIAAKPTSVTPVTEVAMLTIEDYSQHTDDELHQANLDNLAEFDRLREKLESYAYEKVLPALNATIERFNRQGCRMGGKSELAEYLTSIGYNYATVRKWNERCRKRLLKAAATTKPTPTSSLTPEQQEVAEALEAQGCKKGEARGLAKAATGATFPERFKSALASRAAQPTIANEPEKGGAEPVPIITVESPQPPPDAVGEPSQWPPTPNKNGNVAVPAVFPKTASVALPKPGDWSGLVSNIETIAGEHIKAGLEGLEPEVMADVFGKFVQRLAQMYCVDASGSAVELTVTVQKITRKAPMSCKEIRQEWRGAR